MIEPRKNTITLSKGWAYKYGIPFDSASDGVNHERLAHILMTKECEVASVLIVMNHLDSMLWDNPKYMKKQTEIGASEIEVEARRRMVNHYPSVEEVDQMIEKWGLDKAVNNYSKGKTAEDLNSKRHSKLLDLIFQSYNHALYPEILAEYEEGFEADWKEEKKSGDWKAAWENEKIRLLAPTLLTEHNRVYNLPEPFHHWDPRNAWAQFYLVGSHGKVGWVQGGSAGSSQRETHGRWGHAFAALARKGIDAPTYCYRHTSENEFILEKVYEKFRVHRCDLTGNYPAEWSQTKDLFMNRLLSTADGKIVEIKGN
jgi:hypothetical protein